MPKAEVAVTVVAVAIVAVEVAVVTAAAAEPAASAVEASVLQALLPVPPVRLQQDMVKLAVMAAAEEVTVAGTTTRTLRIRTRTLTRLRTQAIMDEAPRTRSRVLADGCTANLNELPSNSRCR